MPARPLHGLLDLRRVTRVGEIIGYRFGDRRTAATVRHRTKVTKGPGSKAAGAP